MQATPIKQGGRPETVGPLLLRGGRHLLPEMTCAAGILAIWAGQMTAKNTADPIVIVRGYDKLGDAKFEIESNRKGPIICYAFDKGGIVIGHQPGYVEAGSIRFYGIPFEDVEQVTCERQN